MCQNWTSALDTRPKFGTFIQKSGQVRSIRFKFQAQNTPHIWPLKSARIKRTCPNLEQTILEGFSKERSIHSHLWWLWSTCKPPLWILTTRAALAVSLCRAWIASPHPQSNNFVVHFAPEIQPFKRETRQKLQEKTRISKLWRQGDWLVVELLYCDFYKKGSTNGDFLRR